MVTAQMNTTPDTDASQVFEQTLPTRWMDNDQFGHLNNSVHHALVDTVVNDFLTHIGLGQDPAAKTRFVVVENGCTYLSEMRYPDRIAVRLTLGRIGKTSVRYELTLRTVDNEAIAAKSHLVHVNVNSESGRPMPLARAQRDALLPYAFRKRTRP